MYRSLPICTAYGAHYTRATRPSGSISISFMYIHTDTLNIQNMLSAACATESRPGAVANTKRQAMRDASPGGVHARGDPLGTYRTILRCEKLDAFYGRMKERSGRFVGCGNRVRWVSWASEASEASDGRTHEVAV
jgi:hypothetical protein